MNPAVARALGYEIGYELLQMSIIDLLTSQECSLIDAFVGSRFRETEFSRLPNACRSARAVRRNDRQYLQHCCALKTGPEPIIRGHGPGCHRS